MRDQLVKNIKDIVLGPLNGNEEKIQFRPLNLYTTGILYPQTTCQQLESTAMNTSEVNPEESFEDDNSENEKQGKKSIQSDHEKGDDDYDQSDDELKLATNFLPSSAGFSFIVGDESEFKLRYSLGRYLENKKKEK